MSEINSMIKMVGMEGQIELDILTNKDGVYFKEGEIDFAQFYQICMKEKLPKDYVSEFLSDTPKKLPPPIVMGGKVIDFTSMKSVDF